MHLGSPPSLVSVARLTDLLAVCEGALAMMVLPALLAHPVPGAVHLGTGAVLSPLRHAVGMMALIEENGFPHLGGCQVSMCSRWVGR